MIIIEAWLSVSLIATLFAVFAQGRRIDLLRRDLDRLVYDLRRSGSLR